jgi:sialate O-acetylesterase
MRFPSFLFSGLIAVMTFAPLVHGDVTLPNIIGDHMVLQQEAVVPIWGEAAAGEKITVTLGQQQKMAAADAKGRWMVKLDPLKSGGPFEMTVAGNHTLTLHGIWVGEVWVCSGQSNMTWELLSSTGAKEAIAESNDPQLHLFHIPRSTSDKTGRDVNAQWTVAAPNTTPRFSAVAYHFGAELRKTLNVPVGLIHASRSGSPVESWTPTATMRASDDYQLLLKTWDKMIANFPSFKNAYEQKDGKALMQVWGETVSDYPTYKIHYEDKIHAWMAAVEKARTEGKPEPRLPGPPPEPVSPESMYRPGSLYERMIAPLQPYAMRGVVWYQGESNAAQAWSYRKLFPNLIQSWRTTWGQGDFPFLFVQVANFGVTTPEPGESNWAELREAQAVSLSVPGTGMATAVVAQARVYGKKDIVFSGPTYDGMKIEGGTIRISFKNAGALTVRNKTSLGVTLDGEPSPQGFAIAGTDRKWVWASAKLKGETVVVWNERIPKPVAVRYAWSDNPAINLYNGAGLPAMPFRTDDWALSTVGKTGIPEFD